MFHEWPRRSVASGDCLQKEMLRRHAEDDAYLELVPVVGVGSALLQALLDWAEDNPHIEKVSLAVFSNNRLGSALYDKFGFLEEGRRVREIKLNDDQYVDEECAVPVRYPISDRTRIIDACEEIAERADNPRRVKGATAAGLEGENRDSIAR